MGKRSQNQGSTSRKRSRLTRLDDVVLKLSSDCDESAAAWRNAVQTLQTGNAIEIRKLCSRWSVRLTAKKDNGKYSERADNVLRSELEDTLIEEAKKHFRAKATHADPITNNYAKSLDDVVSKLSSDRDESAAALRNAVQTLRTGGHADIRKLCRCWSVQLTAKKDNGKYSPRADDVLKSELQDTLCLLYTSPSPRDS